MAAAAPAAIEAEWRTTFNVSAMASYLPQGASNVLLASAGERSESSNAAVRVVAAALRASGRTRTVFDGAMLGSTENADDLSIVAACADLPVELVAVLRVVPPSDGFSESAIVAFYTRDKRPWAAVSAQRGVPMATNVPVAPPPAPSMANPPMGNPGPGNAAGRYDDGRGGWAVIAAQDSYSQHFVGFENPEARTVTDARPFIGIAHKRLEGAAFYYEVGRTELIPRYNKRHNTGLIVSIGAIPFAAVGAVTQTVAAFIVLFSVGANLTGTFDAWGAGIAATLIGVSGVIYASTIQSDPIDVPEAARLIDEHNRKLKLKLGLPVDETSLQWERKSRIELVQPAASGGGLSFRF